MRPLEREYARDQASFVVVYGRRRVGKTALISRFIADKPAIYYLATEESEPQNRAVFQSLVADYLHDDLLRDALLPRWEPVFTAIARSAAEARSNGRRLVIVLDEFQYLGLANPEFPSVFQRIWDTILAKANVMVILCGSLVSMMESQVLSYDSPSVWASAPPRYSSPRFLSGTTASSSPAWECVSLWNGMR